ncbi:hypothetical protein [Lisianthus necrosis virus]|uniref:Uncharacterized protein n=1 Tax=Lisianthus necrosis virus TaxID=334425 RepID=A7M8Y5_9TOMB|nr:hypothetical protein [Lisianthus necrosis virus]
MPSRLCGMSLTLIGCQFSTGVAATEQHFEHGWSHPSGGL